MAVTSQLAEAINACPEAQRPQVLVNSSAVGYYGNSEVSCKGRGGSQGRPLRGRMDSCGSPGEGIKGQGWTGGLVFRGFEDASGGGQQGARGRGDGGGVPRLEGAWVCPQWLNRPTAETAAALSSRYGAASALSLPSTLLTPPAAPAPPAACPLAAEPDIQRELLPRPRLPGRGVLRVGGGGQEGKVPHRHPAHRHRAGKGKRRPAPCCTHSRLALDVFLLYALPPAPRRPCGQLLLCQRRSFPPCTALADCQLCDCRPCRRAAPWVA